MNNVVLIDIYRVARDRRDAAYRQALFCALVDADPLSNFEPPLTDARIDEAIAATTKKPSEIAAAKQAAVAKAEAAFRREVREADHEA